MEEKEQKPMTLKQLLEKQLENKGLHEFLVEIYTCVSAWDNDDGKMAEANEKTPEDLLKSFLSLCQRQIIEEVKKEIEEIRSLSNVSSASKIGAEIEIRRGKTIREQVYDALSDLQDKLK